MHAHEPCASGANILNTQEGEEVRGVERYHQ
jgi:hypothetical protein